MEHSVDGGTGEAPGQLAQLFVRREQALHALRLVRRDRAQAVIDEVLLGVVIEVRVAEVVVQDVPDDAEIGRAAALELGDLPFQQIFEV